MLGTPRIVRIPRERRFGLSVRLPVSGLAMHGDSDNNRRTLGRPFVCQAQGKPRIITMLTKRMLESLFAMVVAVAVFVRIRMHVDVTYGYR